MERPMFFPLLSIVVGLATADLFLFFVPDTVLYLSLAASLPSLLLKRRFLFLTTLSVFFFTWANLSLKPLLLPGYAANDIARLPADQNMIIEGVVDSRPEGLERGSRIYLRTERVVGENGSTPVSGRLLLYVGEGRVNLFTGDRIRFSSRIRKPHKFGIPGEFDFARYLAYRNVYCTAYVKDVGEVVLMRRRVDYRLGNYLDNLAADIGRFISVNAPGEEGFILRALLLGDMGTVSRVTKDAYTRAGVNHILSISGFHVSIIALAAFYLLLLAAKSSSFLLLRFNMRRLLLLCTIPLLFFYMMLSGAAPATVRSVIMIAAYIIAMLLQREVDPINSLMLAAMVILISTPAALFDLSFQLSFLALWGIIALVPHLMTPFRKIDGSVMHKLLLFLMASAAATIATLVPVAYHFHRVTCTGLIANFFIVPLMGYGAVVAGFSALPLMFCFPLLAGLLLKMAAFLVKLSNLIIIPLSGLPALPLFNPTRTDLLFAFLFLACITFVNHTRTRWILCSGALFLSIPMHWAPSITSGHENDLRITFFSVGQGESSLVSFPDGKKMLIDGGGSLWDGGMDTGEKLLAPALWRMGVHRLDYVVLSHPHPDHLKGLQFIVANFEIGEFWGSGIPCRTQECREMNRILLARKIPIRLINAATPPVAVGGVWIEPLAPLSGSVAASDDALEKANELSLVFRLKYQGFSMLFTGDIGFDTEQFLVRNPERLACSILKVAHHGSSGSTSEAFLRAAAPECALISAGYHNSFRLPAQRTISVLRARGIKIYRTDLDGTIVVDYRANRRHISVFSENRHFY